MKVFEFCSNFGFNALYSQIEFIAKCHKEGRAQYVVVPDRFSLSMEKLIMERLNLVSCFDIYVVSFSKLANMVIGNAPTKKVLSMLDAVIITEYILKKNKSKLQCFTKIPASTGFAQVLFDSISQLKSCKITPGMLRFSANKQKNENLKAKINDIALIYELYENFIQDKFMDSNNKLGFLCERMKVSQIFDNADVHFCNFLDFTNQDYDVIKEAIKCAHGVSVMTVQPEKDQKNKSVYMSIVSQRLKEICDELNIKIEKEQSVHKLGFAQEQILKNLFSLEAETFQLSTPQIELYSLKTNEEEISFVIKRIMALLEGGAKFGDISIVCTDINEYKHIISELFEKYKLPFWLDENISLEQTEYYKIIKNVFEAVMYGYQTDDVLKISQNVFACLTNEQREELFVYGKKFGLVGSMWKDDINIHSIDEKFINFLQDKKSFMLPIQKFEEGVKNSKTICDFCEVVKSFIKDLNLEEKAQELSLQFEKIGELKQASIFRQCSSKMDKILEQLCTVLGDEECSIQEWLEMFLSSVKASEISPIPMGINTILVGQMLSTIYEPKKYFFVVGATSSKLPAFQKDVGIISDLDILSLQELNITPTINDINKKTIFTTLQNLCLWQEKLVVTMPRINKNAQNEESQVVDDLQKMFLLNGQNIRLVNGEKLMQDIKPFSNEKNRLKFLLRTNFDVLEFVSKHRNLLNDEEKEILKNAIGEKELSYILKEKDVPKTIENAQNLFFVDGHTKATEIERYFACPFLHFLEYGLKLKEIENNKMRPVDVGNILHDICERYAKFSKGQVLDEDIIEKYAKLFFDEIMQKKEFEHLLMGAQNRALMEGLKYEAIRICKALNYHNKHSKYKIVFAEKSFGEDGFAKMPDICVFNTKRVLKMRGKVDRVDFCDNKFRIVDYKTGKSKSEFKMLNLYMGKKMQLFIYLYALLNTYKDKIPTGAFYFPIHNEYLDERPDFPYQSYCMNGVTINDYENLMLQDDLVDFDNSKSGIINFGLNTKKEIKEANIKQMKKVATAVSQKEMYAMIAYSQKLMSKALSEILSGYIEPKPASEACFYCSAKQFCPFINLKSGERDENFEVEQENFFEEVLKNE